MKYQKAKTEAEKLVDYLETREWNADTLRAIIGRADREMQRVHERMVSDLVATLSGSYLTEAKLWSANEMEDINGKWTKTSLKERRKAQTELKKIQAVIARLNEVTA